MLAYQVAAVGVQPDSLVLTWAPPWRFGWFDMRTVHDALYYTIQVRALMDVEASVAAPMAQDSRSRLAPT